MCIRFCTFSFTSKRFTVPLSSRLFYSSPSRARSERSGPRHLHRDFLLGSDHHPAALPPPWTVSSGFVFAPRPRVSLRPTLRRVSEDREARGGPLELGPHESPRSRRSPRPLCAPRPTREDGRRRPDRRPGRRAGGGPMREGVLACGRNPSGRRCRDEDLEKKKRNSESTIDKFLNTPPLEWRLGAGATRAGRSQRPTRSSFLSPPLLRR